jgi:superfamily II DNA or RNA helicase
MIQLDMNLLAEIGGWPALKEARALVGRGRVRDARREGAVIRATVAGADKVYEAQITLADRVANVEVRCTCAESRRTGRVCAHALAAGLAVLQAGTTAPLRIPAVGAEGTDRGSPLQAERSQPTRWRPEEAPAGTPRLEITVLLPLRWEESLAQESMRIILEARRDAAGETQPFEAVTRGLGAGFAVGEEDERVLAALERSTGTTSGINVVPQGKIGGLLRALDGHPRVWLGKKQRVDVRASRERPRILLSRRTDGALELRVKQSLQARGLFSEEGEVSGTTSNGPPPPEQQAVRAIETERPGWHLKDAEILETPAWPPGFSSGERIIPQARLPDFLTRELPALEASCELSFAPGWEELQLEVGQPSFEARLEGALSGLTLELVAQYGESEFMVDARTESNAYQSYVADPRKPTRFWRRNVRAERGSLAEAEAAGFSQARRDASALTLIQENNVARFLANILPRWRRRWSVSFGPRLEAAMAQVDVAEPEFSLRSGSGEDWLGLDLKLSVDGKPVPLDPAEIQRWLQTGQAHGRMANRRVLLVPTEAWSEMKEVLAECEVQQEPGKIRVGRTYAPYLAGALEAQGFRAGGDVAIDTPAPDVRAVLDTKLWAQLRPYQAQGVSWLAGLALRNFQGLLADDMGLGKTVQALAFCVWLGRRGAPTGRARGPAPATLVVCPTSLVTNWLREAARFTPELRTLDLTGTDRAEKWARRKEYDFLVTSYAILRRDIELYRAEEFLLVILDEAQHIKNRGSQNAQSAKALRARHRLVLTGTPLENSVLDLWSLYDFLLPGYLGSAADFRERYETPLAGGSTGAPNAKLMERLRHRVRPFLLRRTKEEVLTELPSKLEFSTLCELSHEQREVYQAVLAQGRREVFEQAGQTGKGRNRMAVLTRLLRLRQVCCHLDLLPEREGKSGEDKGKSRKEEADAGERSAPSSSTLPLIPSSGRWKEPSAKMERAFELIEEAMDGGHRVLLFSQFVRMLHLLRDEARRREWRFCYLDGQTMERQAEVDRFQEDAEIPLFFISLKAGGTGLNLTGADTVIHFDPWWNPAVEEQATSRAHRMGQARRVQAYKLIAAGTVEEKIQALQARKRELFEASLGGGDEAFVEKLTEEDLQELLE